MGTENTYFSLAWNAFTLPAPAGVHPSWCFAEYVSASNSRSIEMLLRGSRCRRSLKAQVPLACFFIILMNDLAPVVKILNR